MAPLTPPMNLPAGIHHPDYATFRELFDVQTTTPIRPARLPICFEGRIGHVGLDRSICGLIQIDAELADKVECSRPDGELRAVPESLTREDMQDYLAPALSSRPQAGKPSDDLHPNEWRRRWDEIHNLGLLQNQGCFNSILSDDALVYLQRVLLGQEKTCVDTLDHLPPANGKLPKDFGLILKTSQLTAPSAPSFFSPVLTVPAYRLEDRNQRPTQIFPYRYNDQTKPEPLPEDCFSAFTWKYAPGSGRYTLSFTDTDREKITITIDPASSKIDLKIDGEITHLFGLNH